MKPPFRIKAVDHGRIVYYVVLDAEGRPCAQGPLETCRICFPEEVEKYEQAACCAI